MQVHRRQCCSLHPNLPPRRPPKLRPVFPPARPPSFDEGDRTTNVKPLPSQRPQRPLPDLFKTRSPHGTPASATPWPLPPVLTPLLPLLVFLAAGATAPAPLAAPTPMLDSSSIRSKHSADLANRDDRAEERSAPQVRGRGHCPVEGNRRARVLRDGMEAQEIRSWTQDPLPEFHRFF